MKKTMIVLSLLVAPVLLVASLPAPSPEAAAAPLTSTDRARQAVQQHLHSIGAPRQACVVEARPAQRDAVEVAVWWPGDDRRAELPRIVHFSYEAPGDLVLASND